jgi:excisionase family DNA binding protein
MADGPDSQATFLRLGEAAERLGVSRLKLREAVAKGLLPHRRDNEGRLRVDLGLAPDDLVTAVAAAAADPAALMQALFDEIEELSAELDDSEAATERLARLAAAQGEALDRAMAALDAANAERDLMSVLTERALTAAEEAGARAEKLEGVSSRAIGLLEDATGLLEDATGRLETLEVEARHLREELARKDTTIHQHTSQLERMFTISEQALEKAAGIRREPTLIARVFGAGRGGRS